MYEEYYGERAKAVEWYDLILLGRKVKLENINFSLYFQYYFHEYCETNNFYRVTKCSVQPDMRVKIKWNREKYISPEDGYMELYGNYEYIQSENGYEATGEDIARARNFFKKYKVLFAAVWEEQIGTTEVEDYFRELISFEELILSFYYDAFPKGIFDEAESIEDLERIVRKNKLFDMHD